MAVFTSSYCRALPAYLQNFCALVKSSGDSWTPPGVAAGDGGEDGQKLRKIKVQREAKTTFKNRVFK